MAHFPGVEAPNLEEGGYVSVPERITGQWTMSNDSANLSKARSIAKDIKLYRAKALALAVEAEDYINECRAFEAALTPVSFHPPEFLRAHMIDPVPQDLSLINPVIPTDGLSTEAPRLMASPIPGVDEPDPVNPVPEWIVTVPRYSSSPVTFSPPTEPIIKDIVFPKPQEMDPYSPKEIPMPGPPTIDFSALNPVFSTLPT